MTRITINLKEQEKLALRVLAEKEFREPRAQAALIIQSELVRLGLLDADAAGVETMSVENKLKEGGTHASN